MSAAIEQVTLAIQQLLFGAVRRDIDTVPSDAVRIGVPAAPSSTGGQTNAPVSLFLFHLEPNQELRNAPRAIPGAPVDAVPQHSLALDLRYLISVHRQGDGTTPNELLRLGRVIAALQANPTIGAGLVENQVVRLTPEPYPMEEISRIWGLFPNAPYATSVVYLAAPVFVDAAELFRGPPVTARRVDSGPPAEPPDPFSGLREVAP